jgi:hypothetical protein
MPANNQDFHVIYSCYLGACEIQHLEFKVKLFAMVIFGGGEAERS